MYGSNRSFDPAYLIPSVSGESKTKSGKSDGIMILLSSPLGLIGLSEIEYQP